jgi:cysteine sulfinate desulfinase/cysteine desulfurase-like protein
VTRVPVSATVFSSDAVVLVEPDTALLSILWANNETGGAVRAADRPPGPGTGILLP